MCCSNEHKSDKKAKKKKHTHTRTHTKTTTTKKTPHCSHGESCTDLDRRSIQTKHSFKLKPNPEQGPLTFFNSVKSERVAEENLKLAEVDS